MLFGHFDWMEHIQAEISVRNHEDDGFLVMATPYWNDPMKILLQFHRICIRVWLCVGECALQLLKT